MNQTNTPNLTTEFYPIPGFEGLYEASLDGQIRSVERRVRMRGGGTRIIPGMLLRQYLTPKGYPFVQLYKNGKKYVRHIKSVVTQVKKELASVEAST